MRRCPVVNSPSAVGAPRSAREPVKRRPRTADSTGESATCPRDGPAVRSRHPMKFRAECLPGVVSIELEPFRDERGAFARTFCAREFGAAGLPTTFAQMNLSRNPRARTLRGAHFQLPPHGEGKLVRPQRGSLFDVAIDLRPDSPTFGRWFGAELRAEAGNALYVPPGCAHAFVTLEPDTDVFYMATAAYVPGVERGVRWNDPAVGIAWPVAPELVSAKDRSWPSLDLLAHAAAWRAAATPSPFELPRPFPGTPCPVPATS